MVVYVFILVVLFENDMYLIIVVVMVVLKMCDIVLLLKKFVNDSYFAS